MKFASRFVSTAAILLALAAPAAAQDLSQLAPADEYFGRFQLSVLGIANVIRDAEAKLDAGGDAADVIEGPLAFASDALADWEARYPRDPWIVKDKLALDHAYRKARGETPVAAVAAPAPAPRVMTAWERFAFLRGTYRAR
jgi:hypothetical protein